MRDARAEDRETSTSASASLGYMPPLDGVRAFAVVAVMAYHAGVSWLSGGFLGVDVFFVLSGFLITTLLIRERRVSGSIRLGAFWAGRARRLLPALLLMLLFVAAYAYFALPGGAPGAIRSDALFTLCYSANWHFIAESTNYFTAAGPVSPLTHMWSLAVEEQFYLVWPPIVLLVMRRGRQSLGWLLGLSIAGALTSAWAMALLYNGTNDTRLYYGTDTHGQSMLVGAVLAIVLEMVAGRRGSRAPIPRRRRRHAGDPAWVATQPVIRALVSAAGAVGAVALIGLVTRASGTSWWLYHGGFLVSAIASGFVLLSVVCLPTGVLARVLSLSPLQLVGRISYGLYLWHFPLFVWLDHARTGLSGAELLFVRFGATGLVATASFFLVELPIRKRHFLRGWRGALSAPIAIGAVAGSIVLATSSVSATEVTKLASQPVAAHRPRPSPSSDAANVLLVGDSMAETLGNGIEGNVARFFGLNIINAGTPDCALAVGSFEVQGNPPSSSAPTCNPSSGSPLWPTVWASLVRTFNPKVSVLIERLDIVNRLFDGSWTSIGSPTYDTYLKGQIGLAVRTLTSRGGKVLLLTSPYYQTGEQSDGEPWPEDNPQRVNEFNAMLESVAAHDPKQVGLFDLNRMVDPSGHFQFYVDGLDLRFIDGIHWTYEGDCWIAPRLLPTVRAMTESPLPLDPQEIRSGASQAEIAFPKSLCWRDDNNVAAVGQ
jgi:peptidoglycan/LPS O-acetylase OafA/YrhL